MDEMVIDGVYYESDVDLADLDESESNVAADDFEVDFTDSSSSSNEELPEIIGVYDVFPTTATFPQSITTVAATTTATATTTTSDRPLQLDPEYLRKEAAAIAKYRHVWNDAPTPFQRSAMGAFLKGYTSLNSFQVEILDECIQKQTGGMSLPMGSGKTLVSLVLALFWILERGSPATPALFIATITLIKSAMTEVTTWFGDTLRIEVVQTKNAKKFVMVGDTSDPVATARWPHVVLITDPVVAKMYKCGNDDNGMEKLLVESLRRGDDRLGRMVAYNSFRKITVPIYPDATHGPTVLVSRVWSCLIVDEAQDYTNSETQICKGLMCIASARRWMLSGTMFSEPKPTNVLGYYCILNWPGIGRNLPDVKRIMVGKMRINNGVDEYVGLMPTLVHRKDNPFFDKPLVNRQVITHALTNDEQHVYTVLKNLINEIASQIKTHAFSIETNLHNPTAEQRARIEDVKAQVKVLQAGMLTLIMYLRQCLVCPMLPITTVMLNMADMTDRDVISKMMTAEIQKLKLDEYLSNPDNMVSSRMHEVINRINEHPNDRIVVFSSFRTTVDLLMHVFPRYCGFPAAAASEDAVVTTTTTTPTGRQIFTLESKHTMEQRGEVIEAFKATPNGVLAVTYDIASTGLNLQCANTVMIVDFWWNCSKTNQGIARVLRMGQLSKQVNIYFFTSNTNMEQVLFRKQQDKQDIIDELMNGPTKSKGVHRVNMRDLISFLNGWENKDLLTKVYGESTHRHFAKPGQWNGGGISSTSSSSSVPVVAAAAHNNNYAHGPVRTQPQFRAAGGGGGPYVNYQGQRGGGMLGYGYPMG